MDDKIYLGDGVYASLERGMIVLRTLEGNEIFLEDNVIANLLVYIQALKDKSKL